MADNEFEDKRGQGELDKCKTPELEPADKKAESIRLSIELTPEGRFIRTIPENTLMMTYLYTLLGCAVRDITLRSVMPKPSLWNPRHILGKVLSRGKGRG